MRRATNPLKGAVVHDICIIWKLIKYHRRDAILSPALLAQVQGSQLALQCLPCTSTSMTPKSRRGFFFSGDGSSFLTWKVRVGLSLTDVLFLLGVARRRATRACSSSKLSRNCLQTLFEEAKDTLVLLAQPILSDTSITEPQDWFSFMLTWQSHIRCIMFSKMMTIARLFKIAIKRGVFGYWQAVTNMSLNSFHVM